jgi:hypothetical protein
LYAHGIRIFDYPRFAEPLRDRIRERAQEVCAAAGIEIEHVSKSHIRKEELVARVLAGRGDTPGLVHVLSAMEACPSYKPWHDKSSGKTYLRPESGKCLHYYFYFIDEELGLCYLRVPTWAPFGLQFYCNGHSALARRLTREGIDFLQQDNAFLGSIRICPRYFTLDWFRNGLGDAVPRSRVKGGRLYRPAPANP